MRAALAVFFLSLRPSMAKTFTLKSSAFEDGDAYPSAFTCKGKGVSPPLQWKHAPSGTKQFYITLTVDPHPDVDYDRYDWVLYDIDADTSNLEQGKDSAIGTLGGTTPGLEYNYRATCPSGSSTVKTLTFTVMFHSWRYAP